MIDPKNVDPAYAKHRVNAIDAGIKDAEATIAKLKASRKTYEVGAKAYDDAQKKAAKSADTTED